MYTSMIVKIVHVRGCPSGSKEFSSPLCLYRYQPGLEAGDVREWMLLMVIKSMITAEKSRCEKTGSGRRGRCICCAISDEGKYASTMAATAAICLPRDLEPSYTSQPQN